MGAMKVRDIMVADVATVGPRMPLKWVAAVLLERNITGVPVVNDAGRVVGVVSETDILQKELGADSATHRHGGRFKRRNGGRVPKKVEARDAGEAMSAPALAVRPTATVTEAATLMVERHVNRLVVIDDGEVVGPVGDGPLVGIVTRADLVRAFARHDTEVAAEIAELMVRELAIPPWSVTVDVRGGEVALTGHVDARSTVEILAMRVRAVPGVVSVISNVSWRVEEPATA
jgi:CBS domain-containing protein